MIRDQRNVSRATCALIALGLAALAILNDPRVAAAAADVGVSLTALAVVDPDGAGPLSPVVLPTDFPQGVAAGGYVRFDAEFGNAGPAVASNVTLTLQLPQQGLFVGAIATGGVFVPAAQPPASPFTFNIMAGVNVVCTVSFTSRITCVPQADLPVGSTGTLTAFMAVNPSVAGGTVVSGAVNITSAAKGSGATTDDANSGNNTAVSAGRTAVTASNLAVGSVVLNSTPAASPAGAVAVGTAITYRLTVTNNGPSDVENIRVIDTLSDNLRFSSAVQSGGFGTTFTCYKPTIDNDLFVVALGGSLATAKPGGGQVVCTAPSMSAIAPNQTATIDVTAVIDATTTMDVTNETAVNATIDQFHQPTFGSAMITKQVGPAGP